mmetsp:Transcript_18407/g.23976  ORF Transcript_18407/g.23976 Transcript_18407/m.23976 type:complete len:674 (-) Transcript_18407:104-2125(-)
MSTTTFDEKSIRGDLEDYLRKQDMSEYFTTIIETCLLTMPRNPSLHIMNHLMKTFPDQIPTTVAAALMAHNKQEKMESQSSGEQKRTTMNESATGSVSSSSLPRNDNKNNNFTKNVPTSATSTLPDNNLNDEGEEADEDDEEEDHGPIDSIVLKHMAMASEGGVHVSFGGWFEEEFSDEDDDFEETEEDIHGGDVKTRARQATERLIQIAKARHVQAFILKKHQSAGWRHGRRDGISFHTPCTPVIPALPEKLGPFFTRIRNDMPFLEILLPSLAKCRLCADLTDFQLILLGEACILNSTQKNNQIIIPSSSNPFHNIPYQYDENGNIIENDNDIARESLIIIKTGSLIVQEVIPPPPKYPNYDDDTVYEDSKNKNYDQNESGTVIKEISQLEVGEMYGEHNLFAPHELYKPSPSQSSNVMTDDEFNDDEEDTEYGNEYNNNNYGKNKKSSQQVITPSNNETGGGCEYWSISRTLLHKLRAGWSLEEEELKLSFLYKVPGLADCLSELELRQIAALSQQVSYAPGALVVKEGSLIDDLMIITSGFASFTRGSDILMETVGSGAFWGDLSLVQGSRLCQATVYASTQKILNAYGSIPSVYRKNKIEKMKNVVKHQKNSSEADDQSSMTDTDLTPALIVLVVKASVLERIMGPLINFIRRHNAANQAKIFSRIVC